MCRELVAYSLSYPGSLTLLVVSKICYKSWMLVVIKLTQLFGNNCSIVMSKLLRFKYVILIVETHARVLSIYKSVGSI